MKYTYPKFLVACMENNKIWFVPFHINAVFELDIEKENVKFLTMLPLCNYNNSTLGAIIKEEDKLFFVPASGNEFLIYDLGSGNFSEILYGSDEKYKFHSGICCNETIYFIGQENALIAKYDLKDRQFKLIRDFQKEAVCKKNPQSSYWSRGNACVNDMKLLIPNIHNSFILLYNMDTDTYLLHDLRVSESGFSDILYADNLYWLLPRTGDNVYWWSFEDDCVQAVKKECDFTATGYMHAFVVGQNKIVIIDFLNLNTYLINTVEKSICKFDLDKKLGIELNDDGVIIVRWIGVVGTKIYVNMSYEDYLVEYDFATSAVKRIRMELNEQSRLIYIDMVKREKGIFTEKMPYLSISSFGHREQTTISDVDIGKTGKRIYDAVVNKKIE